MREITEMKPMERSVNQDLFYYILGEFYKEVEDEHDYVFENDVFSLRYYNWGNYDDETEDENIVHFYHKPSGLKVGWYQLYEQRCVTWKYLMTNGDLSCTPVETRFDPVK